MSKEEQLENKSYIKEILKVQLIWYLINFLILFFQSSVSFKLPYMTDIYRIVFEIIGKSIFISFLLYWSTMIYDLSFQELGITFRNFINNFNLGIKISSPLLLGIIIIQFSLQKAKITPFIEVNNLENLQLSLIYFIILFIGFFIPAFSKELLYRGFIYYHFKRDYGIKIGFLFSNLYYITSYLNLRIGNIILYLIIGVITTYLYEKTESLLTSTIFQATYQASLTLYLFSFSNQPF